MSEMLHIGDGIGEDHKPLALPAEAVTQAIGILARRGAGKTHTATVLVEEVIEAGLPVVILDPTGAWWGLRSSADGNKPGLPVVILGGEHGDVSLERADGKKVADLVIDHPGAFVIDLSGFESRQAEQTFAADFLERLYRGKATKRDALLVVVDEADAFAPQRPGKEQLRTLGALEAIIRRGRIRGLGAVLISQRAAVINKNVLTQIEVLIALQTTAPQDRKAVKEWVAGHATDEEAEAFADSLASLGRGEAWVWSPSWLRILRKVQIRQRRTFDSSKTPGAGEVAVEPRVYAEIDIESLGEQIAATVERQKANDPAALRRRISELERQAASRPTETRVETVTERVEVPVLQGGELDRLEAMLRDIENLGGRLHDLAGEVRMDLKRATGAPIDARAVRPAILPREPIRAPVRQAAVERVANPDGITIGKGERTVMGVLRQWPDGRTYNELAFLAGYSAKASTLGVILSKLRQAGYVAPGNQPVILTPEGMEAAGGVDELPTGQALLDHWLQHPRMGKGERDVLRVLIEQFPHDLSNDELCDLAGYSPTASTMGVILSKLRKLGLVEKSARRLAPEFAEAIA